MIVYDELINEWKHGHNTGWVGEWVHKWMEENEQTDELMNE